MDTFKNDFLKTNFKEPPCSIADRKHAPRPKDEVHVHLPHVLLLEIKLLDEGLV